MYIKWIGAVLIVAGCGSCGFLMAQNYKREERYLRQLHRILETMEWELSCRRTPLPQLLRSAAGTAQGELKKLLLELAGELELQIVPDAACCTAVVLDKFTRLPKSAMAVLTLLGQSLGRFDLEGQLGELASVKAECSRLLEEHCAGRESRIRNYQTLGLCAGAALAILFV